MQSGLRQAKTVDSQLQEVDDEHLDLDLDLKLKSESKIQTGPHSDGKYKQKVMEDLDALLADLQSTTAHISSYQAGQQQQPHQQQHSQPKRQDSNPYSEPYEDYNSGGVRSNSNFNGSNAHPNNYQPPYPNNRYNNGVINYNQQPPPPPQQHSTGIYRQVNSRGYQDQGQGQSRDPGGVVTVKRVSYGSSDDGGGHSGSSTPPPLPPPPPSEVLDSLALAGGGVGPDELDGPVYQQQNYQGGGGGGVMHRQGSAKGRGERMSALSNNLSELDQLLQDLNSAQFMAEVDRKSSNIIKVLNYLEDQNEAEARGQPRGHGVNEATTVVNGGPAVRSPAVAPKPVRAAPQRTSVDNLLDELEAATPQPGRFPVDPIDPHYQELSTVSTQYHQQQQRLPQQQQHSHHHQLRLTGNNSSPYPPASSSSTSSSSSYHHPQTASTATRELDELMNSLSEFKLQNTDEIDPEPAYAKPVKSRMASEASPITPQGSGGFPPQMQQQNQQQGPRENGQLESMLGDLQTDMNRQGVNTKQKGVCAACQKPIVGQVIAALGKTWHVEHFVCAHCEEPLGTRNFYERDSLAYCETDYHHLFAPRCAYCNGPIVDKCIEALNKMWHPEHFFCAQCGRPFGEEDFHEKNGQAYCREDYFQLFAPKCGGCALPIMENYITALNRQWHPECFVCWDCRAPFGAGSFFDYEGLPYCETHYHAKKGSLCAGCEKPITGRCITAMFKKFHPEHFVCAFCLKQLNKGTFKEQNDKPYCHPCFVKLFG